MSNIVPFPKVKKASSPKSSSLKIKKTLAIVVIIEGRIVVEMTSADFNRSLTTKGVV